MNCFLVNLMIFYILSSVATLDVEVSPAVFNATIGEEVLLNCLFSHTTEFDLKYIVIEWNQRTGDNEKAICLFDFGEYESYRPGSSLSLNEISKGNASLLLKNVTISDIGSYSCTVTIFSDKKVGRVTLSVTAPPAVLVNTINITIEPGEDKAIICEMQNFYPENHSVTWLKSGSKDSGHQVDITSQAVSGIPQQNQDGTFNLISFLIIKGNQTDDGSFYICEVSHEALKTPQQKVVRLTIKGSKLTSRSGILLTVVLTFLITAVVCFGTCLFYNKRTDTPRVTNIIKSNHWNPDNPLSLACAVFWFRPKAIVISWYRKEVGKFQRVLIGKWDSTSHCADRRTEGYFQNEQEQDEMLFTEGEYDITVALQNHKGSGTYSLISQLTFTCAGAAKRMQTYYFDVQHYSLKQTISKSIVVEIEGVGDNIGYFPTQMKRKDWAVQAIEEGRRTVVNYISPNILPLLNILMEKKMISENDRSDVKAKPDIDKGRTLLDMMSHRGQQACAQFFNILQDTDDLYPGIRSYITSLLESYTEKDDRPIIDLLHEDVSTVLLEVNNEKSRINNIPEEIFKAVAEHKNILKAQMERIKPYFAFDNSRPLLQEHFTSLVILNVQERNKTEHELLQHRDYTACERTDLKQLLSPSAPGKPPPRVTLVQGVAGIGKSVMMQKLAHSWACGTIYTGFYMLLYFSFRELNTITEKISLTELIICSYPHLTVSCKKLLEFSAGILFLLDGLDEFKWSLEFNVDSVDCPSIAQHINHLIVSIIKGDLLHDATVLITSRPTSIDLEHKTHFNRCAEILGFSRKEIAAYFLKCLKDKNVADRVFQTVKSIDSLYGLCYVPAFCDILCFYLRKSFHSTGKWSNLSSFPRTITDLFLRFTKCLLGSTNGEEDSESFYIEDEDKNEIINLAQLAWDGVINKTIIFSSKDIERNISQKAKVKKSFWKKILTKESLEMMHSHIWQFFHLTHQEFFAALYCISGVDHVHKAFSSKGSTFEIVLRFTAGLVSRSNRKLVKQLVPEHQVREREVFAAIENAAAVDVPKEDKLTPENIKKYTAHKRQKLTASHCLYEAANEDLTKLVASQTSDIVNFSYISLNVTDCTVIANLLSFHTTIEALELDGCKAGAPGFQRLKSVFSRVKTLSLEGNMLEDEGAEIIGDALKNETCRIETLRLKHNSIGEKGAAQIAEALKTNSSLKILGLRANVVKAKGAQLMAEALEVNTTLRVLGLQCNKIGDEGAMYMARAVERNCSLVELRLGDNEITDKGSDYFRSALEVNGTLEELWILVNNISSAGKERLKNARHKNLDLQLN
ncbi:NLR family CARD domain-containing protein 3-like [Pristis pectinata]|uniref:NLR family CARD domain-containing protein 3-like n=1 Tax=Pristis pectinata TaxID=685728 RepID=UPI00223E7BAF|nr:NLR family CARD domain-containing protein 3-like [Pristis pectinata]